MEIQIKTQIKTQIQTQTQIKTSQIKKHWIFFLAKIKLSFKTGKEYKANFWSMIIFDITILLSYMILFSMINQLSSDYLDWEYKDFLILFFLNLLMWKFLWLHNLRNFGVRLLRGELNISRTKPINTYFMTTSNYINSQNIISGLFLFLIILFSMFYFNYSNQFLTLILILFSFLYFVVFFNFFNSIYFFMKSGHFFTELFFRANSVVKIFSPKVFDKLSIFWIFYLLPTTINGFFVIEMLNGRIGDFLFFLPFILISFVIFIFGIYLMWHYGLKNYEGYG
ncbi:MAG: ABC-2 family transporter protein [Nanoarchaeota archaeon]|nr:ABC-2 family transporter protein [Nanoarchaeota archaeon]